jgi:hypothetical protein
MEMMKRTNQPSAKTALQVLIKQVLQSSSKISTLEFIQKLEDRGVNVLFNQASTGYVSGISYSYEGITITGAKLGNDFKWTSIKKNIDYEQERDRTAVYQANVRTRSIQANNGLVTANGAGERDTGASQQRARELPQKRSNDITNTGDSVQKSGQRVKKSAPSNSRFRKIGQPDKSKSRAKSTAPSLANILERGNSGLLFSTSHVTNSGPGVVPLDDQFKKKKKKKRRAPRL